MSTLDQEIAALSYANIGNLIYPVGSYFITESDDDPATLFGGTWTRIKDTFILAKGDTYTTTGGTGGAATVTLNANQLPSLSGTVLTRKTGANGAASLQNATGIFSVSTASVSSDTSTFAYTTALRTSDKLTVSFGGGQSHNNMPPYRIANVWKRETLAS